MTARDTTTDKASDRDPRANGRPHYFVQRQRGGPTCSVCGQLPGASIHLRRDDKTA